MIDIKLDWKAYFEQFCAKHGEPVQVGALGTKSRLLFRDGWMYSANDHAGPEYPPPDSEAKCSELKMMYWRVRRRKVVGEQVRLQRLISFLEDTQQHKSCKLMQRIQFEEELEDGRVRKTIEAVPVNIDEVKKELRYTEKELAECDHELEKLNTCASI